MNSTNSSTLDHGLPSTAASVDRGGPAVKPDWSSPDDREKGHFTGLINPYTVVTGDDILYMSLLPQDAKMMILGFFHIEIYATAANRQFSEFARRTLEANPYGSVDLKSKFLDSAEKKVEPTSLEVIDDGFLVGYIRAMFSNCTREKAFWKKQECNSCPFHLKWKPKQK